MNGNLSMDKSYINNSKYRIKIPSVVDEYFSANNNLKLDYYKEFDFMKLIEPHHDMKHESKQAIRLLFEFVTNDYQESIVDAKLRFFENSHRSFLYAKSMVQSLNKGGVHHPVGVVAIRPSKFDSDVKRFEEFGWKIISDDLVIYLYSGVARLRYFHMIGWNSTPVFMQSVDEHDIDWDESKVRIDSIDKLKNEYSNKVKWNTQFYQEDKFFYFMKHQLDEENQSFNKLTDKIFGLDAEKECLSHLVCTDLENNHKEMGWNDENYEDYTRIIKHTFQKPLNVYIGKCDSKDSVEFNDCKNRILNSLYTNGKKIDINFKHIDSVGNIPKESEYCGFSFYTDCDVKWDFNLLELFYFTHSQRDITDYIRPGVKIVNCEVKSKFLRVGSDDLFIGNNRKMGSSSLSNLNRGEINISSSYLSQGKCVVLIRDIIDKWRSGFLTECSYFNRIIDISAKKFNIPIPKTNEIVKIILDSHRIDGNIDWMTYRHAKFWKWNDYNNLSLLDLSKMENVYFLDLKDLSNPKFLEWLQNLDSKWKCIDEIPYINNTENDLFKLYDLFWKSYQEGKVLKDEILVNPFYDLPGNKLSPQIDDWNLKVKEEQKVVDYIRNSHERYIRFE